MNDADPILNYAPIRRRTWREYLQVTVDSLIRIGMLVVLTGVVLVAAAALLRPHYSVERYTHEHYWKVLLNGWGYEVDRDATSIVYVWNGRDTHNYFRLNQAAAAACADKCLQEYVQKQLDILRNAGVANAEDPRLMELGALTGQDVKGDLSVWKAQISAHLTEIKGGDDAYRRLLDARSQAARADLGFAGGAMTNYRDPLYRQAYAIQLYQTEVSRYWLNPLHILGAALLPSYGAILLYRWVRYRRARRLKATFL